MPRIQRPAAEAKPPPTPPEVPQLPEESTPAAKKAPTKKAAAKKATQPPLSDQLKDTAPDDFGFGSLDETTEYLNLLSYGREGTGKTTALALAANLAPDGSRVLVINAEGGLKKIALRKRGVDTGKVVVWPAPDSGIQVNSRTLSQLHERLLANLTERPGSWFAVIVDSATEVHVALREHATAKRLERAFANPKIVDKSVIDEDFVDRDDYGVMTNQLRTWLRNMRDLPCHTLITALERVDDGIVGPALTPALAGDVLGYVDCAIYHRATQHAAGEDEDDSLAEFRALTRPGKATRAKDRFDMLPRVLVDPSFPRIWGYINGEVDESTDPIQQAYVARRATEAAAREAAEAERAARKGNKSTTKDAADSGSGTTGE